MLVLFWPFGVMSGGCTTLPEPQSPQIPYTQKEELWPHLCSRSGGLAPVCSPWILLVLSSTVWSSPGNTQVQECHQPDGSTILNSQQFSVARNTNSACPVPAPRSCSGFICSGLLFLEYSIPEINPGVS